MWGAIEEPQSPEEAKSPCYWLSWHARALTLDSTDAVGSWAPDTWAVGRRKEFISLPCCEGRRLCWVRQDLWPLYKAIHGHSVEPAAANRIKLH